MLFLGKVGFGSKCEVDNSQRLQDHAS